LWPLVPECREPCRRPSRVSRPIRWTGSITAPARALAPTPHACPSPGLIVLRREPGLSVPLGGGRTDRDATIGPGGEVEGTLGAINLSARLAQGRIEGDISNEPAPTISGR
ncbi:MAG: hypothetical protein FWD12_02115, partial [Alphaproteobacteria bacterium]|nr:hypothetical protein [Alphaproteobacteria bacterium]